MASALPPVDESVRWSCARCRFRHRPGSTCPQAGVWLVGMRPLMVARKNPPIASA